MVDRNGNDDLSVKYEYTISFYANVLLQGDMSSGNRNTTVLCVYIVKKNHYIVSTISFFGQYDTTYKFAVTT